MGLYNFTQRPAFARLHRGPLGPHLDGFVARLAQQGYGRNCAWTKARLVADLSLWMRGRRIAPRRLNEPQLAAFLQARWRQVPRRCGDRATMRLLLRHLRQSNVTLAAAPQAPRNDIDRIVQEYGDFLLRERSLLPGSVEKYLAVTRRFLANRFPDGQVWLKRLRAADVTEFVLHDTRTCSRRYAQLMTTVLRGFLGFLLLQGRIALNLAASVPALAGGRLSVLPRFLETDQVERLLRHCDRRRRAGRRDYAMLLLLARLGLRAGEVAQITFEDIDWRAGELLVRGKGVRVDRLPLPQDVGQALAAYLQKGRPPSSSRRVFIQSRAPREPLTAHAVGAVVRAALARAHIQCPHRGAHMLRHSLATTMLRRGASLAQIGQVLRHQLPQTTEIYAKVDWDTLRALALPWPGGGR